MSIERNGLHSGAGDGRGGQVTGARWWHCTARGPQLIAEAKCAVHAGSAPIAAHDFAVSLGEDGIIRGDTFVVVTVAVDDDLVEFRFRVRREWTATEAAPARMVPR